jgi:centromeric protein E
MWGMNKAKRALQVRPLLALCIRLACSLFSRKLITRLTLLFVIHSTIVAIRMRPLNTKEANAGRVWRVLPQYNSVAQTTNTGQPLPEAIVNGRTFFAFDKMFGEDADNVKVYENVAKGIVKSAVAGLNGTIFAYGQTSSGKTYTMQGSGSNEEGYSNGGGGIVHLAANDIFNHVKNTPDRTFEIRASFIEIYNEEVRDLLGDNAVLAVREDPHRGFFVSSVEEIVMDFESLLRVLFSGEKNRAVAATGMNERSSRSHTIFRITIESRQKTDDGDDDENLSNASNGSLSTNNVAVRISTLNLVDLAGSDSVRHTGSTGFLQRKEGGKINQR